MKHVFWLIQGELCGRSGPNYDPWSLKVIAANGIGAILSVNEGESVYADEIAAAGLEHACIPFSANAPPMLGDLELCLQQLPRAYAYVSAQIDRGKTTLVHCRQGRDRTGLFMAYFLHKRHALNASEAIARVKLVRPAALSAPGWEDFAEELLDRC